MKGRGIIYDRAEIHSSRSLIASARSPHLIDTIYGNNRLRLPRAATQNEEVGIETQHWRVFNRRNSNKKIGIAVAWAVQAKGFKWAADAKWELQRQKNALMQRSGVDKV